MCQFQERFPLSVIKCSVAVINLFRSIVDDDDEEDDVRRSAAKLKCIDIEKLIIKEWQKLHKERQYLALAFLLCMYMENSVASLMRKLNIFKKVNKITRSQKKKIQKPSETPRNNFKTFSLTADPSRHSDTTATLTQTRGMAVPVCA